MTCIVAVEDRVNGLVVMGGDSAGVAGYDLTVRADEKVFTLGPMVLGFTSSFRMGQLLRYQLKLPTHQSGMPDHEYLVTVFVDACRKTLKDGGFARKENDVEAGGTFLVGYRGHVYMVGDDYQVGRARDGFDAVGCGDRYAIGYLHGTSLTGAAAVRGALRVAERRSAGVCGPFVIRRGGHATGMAV